MVSQLKAYLHDVDFEETAQRIAEAVNTASPDCTKERLELADIDKKISNGVKAVISGMDIPELQTEIDRLRTRKSELEDTIAHKENGGKKINPDSIVGRFNRALDCWDSNLKRIIQEFVAKIYANSDGSFTVEVGVHIDGAGGLKPFVCATFVYPAA